MGTLAAQDLIRLAFLGDSPRSKPVRDAAQRTQGLEVAVATSDDDGLLGRVDVDAIYISLSGSLRFEWALKSLLRGKHVLLEKPALLEPGQAEALAKAAAHSGLVVMEAVWYRYHPQVAALRDAMRAAAVGPVRSLAVELGGGAITDILYNQADLLTHVMGIKAEDLVHVDALADRGDAVTKVYANLKTASGVAIGLTASVAREASNRTLISGERGSILVPNLLAYPEAEDAALLFTGAQTRLKTFRRENSYARMLEAFADGIRGRRENLVALEETEANLKILRLIETASGLRLADHAVLFPYLASKARLAWRRLAADFLPFPPW